MLCTLWKKIGCKAVTALIQYFFLVAFSWMLCEGIMLYLMLVRVFSTLKEKWWFFLLLGWGELLLVVHAYDYWSLLHRYPPAICDNWTQCSPWRVRCERHHWEVSIVSHSQMGQTELTGGAVINFIKHSFITVAGYHLVMEQMLYGHFLFQCLLSYW